jgi:hypothetical protein
MRPVALHDHQTRMPLVRLRVPGRTRDPVAQEHPMLDIFMLALGLGFFVVGIGYAYACERL